MIEQALRLPSPIQKLEHPLFSDKGIQVFMKRDDLIHSEISGNKWRKLKYNIIHAQNAKHDALLTFGGAFSNHIAATAAACRLAGIKSIGLIRGEDTDLTNPTLARAIENGMQILPISRSEYAEKNEPLYIEFLRNRFPNTHIIPEGGANFFGVNGCVDILKEVDREFDYVVCAVGTGTTLAGMAISLTENQKIIGFPAIKGGDYLLGEIKNQLTYALFEKEWVNDVMKKMELNHDYSFGGFAKISDELKQFQSDFFNDFQIELDFIYTAKLLYGFYDLIKNDKFPKGSRILIYHSGGLQGNLGFQ